MLRPADCMGWALGVFCESVQHVAQFDQGGDRQGEARDDDILRAALGDPFRPIVAILQ
jgi:hypothetical protein